MNHNKISPPDSPSSGLFICLSLWKLLHHDFLYLHLIAVDETEHVDARSGVHADTGAAIDAFALQDAACDVDHL